LNLHHDLTGELSDPKPYHILILGTGYERMAALKLLANSDLGRRFGIDDAVDSTQVTKAHAEQHHASRSSSPSTPNSLFSSITSENETTPATARVVISRRYRILPVKPFRPRVYVQGASEMSHGLSDTLLSVVSMRAGEILDDLESADE